MHNVSFSVKMARMAAACAAGMLLAAGIPAEAEAAQVFTAPMECLGGSDSGAPVATVSVDDESKIPDGAKLRFVEVDSSDQGHAHVYQAIADEVAGKGSFAVYDIYLEDKDGKPLEEALAADISIDANGYGYMDVTRDAKFYGVSKDGKVSEQGILDVTESKDGQGRLFASHVKFRTEDLSGSEAVLGDHATGWASVRNDGGKDIVLRVSIEAGDKAPDSYALYFDGERSDSQASDGMLLCLGGGQEAVIQGIPAGAEVSFSYAGVPEREQVAGNTLNSTLRDTDIEGAQESMVVFTGRELEENGLSRYDDISRNTMGVVSSTGIGTVSDGSGIGGSGNGSGGNGSGIGGNGGNGGSGINGGGSGSGEDGDGTGGSGNGSYDSPDKLPDGSDDDGSDGDSWGTGPDGPLVSDPSTWDTGNGDQTYDSPVNLQTPTQNDYDDSLQVTDVKKDITPKTGDSAKGLIPAAGGFIGSIAAAAGAFVLRKRKCE